jgi:serine/threonine protein kinase/tetratricopeptide (TPR) repeat protein
VTELASSSFGDFRLGEWLIQPRLNRISRGDSTITLELKFMQVLVCLAHHAGDLVKRRDLIDEVWATEFIGENALTRAIAVIRKALGDDARHPSYIETIHRRGYRLLMTPGTVSDEESSATRTVSHFLLLEQIGAGGMGVVYRAHDRRLARDVAIKMLPENLARDEERLARFEREARLLASLNHPNIATLHGLEEHKDQRFLVMELADGETLAERIEKGLLPIDDALEIALQMTAGLEAAHERGIVHRDLKPANVMVNSDGRVKILDFGLAKAFDSETSIQGGPESLAESPTLTAGLTRASVLLGTASYMSPEQARGRPVDHRSDIFSLGIVLYELFTGMRPFTGDSTAMTLSAILNDNPPSVLQINPSLPHDLGIIVRRCLEKRPQARFQSASDLAYNLRTISSASTPSAARDTPSRTWRGKRTTWIAVSAVVVLGLAIVLIGALRSSRDEAVSSSSMRSTLEWVAVEPFENRTGDASLEPLGRRAVDLIIQRFSEVGTADSVLTMDAVPFSPGEKTRPEPPPRDASGITPVGPKGPHVLISGSYYLDGEELEFQARLTDYETGELVYAFKPINATRSGSAAALDELRERVVAAVQFHRASRWDARLFSPPSSYDALSQFRHALKDWGSDYEKMIAGCNRALELDQGFHMPRFAILGAYRNMGDMEQAEREASAADELLHEFTVFERLKLEWSRARAQNRLLDALDIRREMFKMAPHRVRSRENLAFMTTHLNRPRETLEFLEPTLPIYKAEIPPTGSGPLDCALKAYHSLAEYEQQLEWADVGLRVFADTGGLFAHKGGALAAMGRFEAMNQVIDECTRVQLRDTGGQLWESARNAGSVMGIVALELRAHGHRRESDELAQRAVEWYERQNIGIDLAARDSTDLRSHSWVLRIAGRWDEAKPFLVELLEREEQTARTIAQLGVIAARTGESDEAWRIFDEIPNLGSQSNPVKFLWRSYIPAHLGEKDLAVELLKEGYANGLSHYWVGHINVGLEPIWDYPPFQELIEPKG